MAELADAHGSGPCEVKFMGVRISLSAPLKTVKPLEMLESVENPTVF
jgi:hypothetical protein